MAWGHPPGLGGLRLGIGAGDFDGCERRWAGGTLRGDSPETERPGTRWRNRMKIVVIGGTGLLGSKPGPGLHDPRDAGATGPPRPRLDTAHRHESTRSAPPTP